MPTTAPSTPDLSHHVGISPCPTVVPNPVLPGTILTWPALVAPIIAAFLGGLLIDVLSWHWIFFTINSARPSPGATHPVFA